MPSSGDGRSSSEKWARSDPAECFIVMDLDRLDLEQLGDDGEGEVMLQTAAT